MAHPGSLTTNTSKGLGDMHEFPINHCAHRDRVHINVNGGIVIDDSVCSEARMEWIRRSGSEDKGNEHGNTAHEFGTKWKSEALRNTAKARDHGTGKRDGGS